MGATSAAWEQAKAVVDAAEERKARRSTERAPKAAAATHERVACRICERTFRASDTQSFERHYATCKEKQARRKEYHEAAVEDTQKKVSEAKQDILKAEAIRDDTLKKKKSQTTRPRGSAAPEGAAQTRSQDEERQEQLVCAHKRRVQREGGRGKSGGNEGNRKGHEASATGGGFIEEVLRE